MVEVKICGLSTPETLSAALAAGADYVGLVFYPPSPRYVSLAQAADLAALARGKARIVALVVDADDRMLADIARTVKPDIMQCHGSETPARLDEIRALVDTPLIKAIKVAAAADVARAQDFAGHADIILFDAKAPEHLLAALPGGNGLAFDWQLLDRFGERARFMLSGGLTPANVAGAIAMTGAPMVDVSSGVETAPGKKDVALIRKFIEAARSAR
jgi:phosphoribosylanthranilate isomerase